MKYRVIFKSTIFVFCLTFVVERSVQKDPRPRAVEIKMTDGRDEMKSLELRKNLFWYKLQYFYSFSSDLINKKEPRWIGLITVFTLNYAQSLIITGRHI